MDLSNAFRSPDYAPTSTPEVAPMTTSTDWLPTITAVTALGLGEKSARALFGAGIADFTAVVPMQVRVRTTQQAAPPRGVFR